VDLVVVKLQILLAMVLVQLAQVELTVVDLVMLKSGLVEVTLVGLVVVQLALVKWRIVGLAILEVVNLALAEKVCQCNSESNQVPVPLP
jgi:hypothetical protein